ncbi:MAG: hypothetical protein KGS72_24170 [Cyanobacteria bacterium REEB67]|nr:hypothetical protein [Cyanobacteria bacterium REEB67]
MSIHSNFKNGTVSAESRSRDKTSSNSAMHHWFECNQGLQRKAWPSTYQPNYQFVGLRKPDGVGEKYWDTLARAEKHWITDPVKSQFGDELTEFWSERSEPRISGNREYYTDEEIGAKIHSLDEPATRGSEAIVIDFSARLANMESSRQSKANAAFVAGPPVQIFSRQFSYASINPAWKFAASW